MSEKSEQNRELYLPIDKNSQINVVINNTDEDDEIDLGSVFHNIKEKAKVYLWVLLLCAVLGMCAALLMYQFSKKYPNMTSVVTLDYDVANPNNPRAEKKPVTNLTAPDGTDLDLSQITSSYVLQNALNDLVLSDDISVKQLRDNIQVERILTEDSRRQQEVASRMLADKNNQAYAQLQSVKLTYINQFVVSLNNGFGNPDARQKIYLPDNELQTILNRILASYNDFLVETYQNFKLPSDDFSVIDIENLDIMESLELLRTAIRNLYNYCSEMPDEVKAYRSLVSGTSLNDIMETIQLVQEVHVDYLYSYIYANSVAKDREILLRNYNYNLREAQTKLDIANEKITVTDEVLKNYKNDQIFVDNQESNNSKSTQITTDYYNSLILEQGQNYEEAAQLEIEIADLKMKISNLLEGVSSQDVQNSYNELQQVYEMCQKVYALVCSQMEEIMTKPFYTTFADYTAAQGKVSGTFSEIAKNAIIGIAGGGVIGCGIWFFAAFGAELMRKRKDEPVEQGA